MVYPGHPSTGCLQCIRRKVKCDESKPDCRRCVNRGEQCPGYQRPRYRFVASNSRGRGRNRGIKSLESTPASSKEIERRISNTCPKLDRRLSPSTTRHCEVVPWYFATYIIAQENGEAEWFTFLPKMYQESPQGSHLRMAVDAVSLAAYSNHFRIIDLISDARKAYGTALLSLNCALRDDTEAKLDQTLTAVLMLLMFETITAGETPLDVHINGLLSMLQLRGVEQFQTARGRMLFRLVQLHLQTRPVMQKCQHSISSVEYDINAHAIRVLPTLSSENSRVTARAVLTFRINQLCVKAAGLIHNLEQCSQRKAELQSLVEETTILDDKLERWMASFPSNLHPKAVRNMQDGSRRLIYLHHMIPIAWNMYRCGRIMLHEMRLRCKWCLMTEYGENSSENQARNSTALVQSLAQDICDSISFCLYEIGDDGISASGELGKGKHAAAYLLLWPLLVVKLGSYTTPDQQQRASVALERIGNEVGIKQALRLLRDRSDLFEI